MVFWFNGPNCWNCKTWECLKSKFWDCSDVREVGCKTSSWPMHINKNMICISLNKNSEKGYMERWTLGLSHYRCSSRIYFWDEKHLTSDVYPKRLNLFLTLKKKKKTPDIMCQGLKIYMCAIAHIFRHAENVEMLLLWISSSSSSSNITSIINSRHKLSYVCSTHMI